MPETPRKNKWILVATDHFTRWQDAIAIPDATAPVVASALDERIFCYFGLPEQLHTDQGAQFESQLLSELCVLWNVNKTHTTPYHPQANGVCERNNRGLGDSLRTLLLTRGQDEWDSLLPQLMRAFRGTPHSATGETANLLMMGRELRLPDQLQHHPPPLDFQPQHTYVQEMKERLEEAHQILQRTPVICRRRFGMVAEQKKKERRESEITTKIFGAIPCTRS
jgi:transposase InsO family protein